MGLLDRISLPETGMPLLGAAYGESNQKVKLELAPSPGKVFLTAGCE